MHRVTTAAKLRIKSFKELKNMCKQYKLSTAGNKRILLQRMTQYLFPNHQNEEESKICLSKPRHDSKKPKYTAKNFKKTRLISTLINSASFLRLKLIMNKYNTHSQSTDDVDIHLIVNDFLSLLQKHNEDDEFEYIYQAFGGVCGIQKCQSFRRNYRNRIDVTIKAVHNITVIHSVKMQILDRIHCFYQHSFDIGYRMNFNDRLYLKNNPYKQDKYCLQKKQLAKLKQLLSSKHQMCWNNMKFNQLNFQNVRQNSLEPTYSFGYKFMYGYDNEDRYDDNNIFGSKTLGIAVSRKYYSLKAEMIYNKISRMNIVQFNNEYKKAMAHFVSDYCKKQFKHTKHSHEHRNVDIQHLLALMIYCNYDHLQYEFSKTYREQHGEKHHEYYHLGKKK
eukprot:97253_1